MISPLPTPLELIGCLQSRLSGPASRSFQAGMARDPLNDWYRDIVPTYNQHYDSCVGHAWANWMECMLRRYVRRDSIPENRQINGDWIWMNARKKHWGGVMKGGIFIPQGFEAMVDLGWIPPDASLVEVPADFGNYNRALAATPLVQGHQVTAGWFDASRENGCIAHTYKTAMSAGGHCTLGISVAVKEGVPYRGLLNSWGPDWGWNGIGLMTDEYWLDTALDDVVYTVAPPPGRGWDCLTQCTGWKDALISTPHE